MSDAALMLAQFHAALGDDLGRGNAALRLTLHEEEHDELLDELSWKRLGIDVREPKADEDVDRAKLARELADILYITYGTAHAFAIDLDIALAEVHRAAINKLFPYCLECDGRKTIASNFGTLRDKCPGCGGTGTAERVIRGDGKLMKPPGFVPPDMSAAIK